MTNAPVRPTVIPRIDRAQIAWALESIGWQNRQIYALRQRLESLVATEQQLSDAIDGLKTALDSESGVIAQVVQEISDLANQASSQPVTQEQLDDLAVRAQTALTEAQQNLTDLQAASGGTPPTP